MANILGLPFDDWVKKQIETRQKSLGKGNIPARDYQYYTTKAPFLRLASSVNLTNNGPENTKLKNSVLQKLIENGVPSNLIEGDKLAKNFILQGGVTSVTENEDKLEFGGLEYGLNNGSLFNGSYGWGGISERGYVPMPGITNADVTYYNNGALSKTTINIRCFSKAQFQLIDALYLRPGYSLLLEFGHSQYLDNSGNLKTFENFLTTPMSYLLKGDTSQWGMHNAIQEAREDYAGNYEAVYGMISKFNWQFNPDGSYDCQVQLTGMGTVIESLKINVTSPDNISQSTGSLDVEEDPLYRDRNKTVIHSELFRINQIGQTENIFGSNYYSFLNYQVYDFKNEKQQSTYFKEFKNSIFVLRDQTTDKDTTTPGYQVYIRYGAFLAFLQSKVFLYDKNTNTPLLMFDIDFDDLNNDKNYILNIPGQLSTNPQICLIPSSQFEMSYEGKPIGFDLTLLDIELDSLNFKKGNYLGRLANILVNINFLSTALSQITIDDDGNISLLSYLQAINRGIIQSTGNINKFDVRLNQDQTLIQFVEDIPQNGAISGSQDYAKFNVFGVKENIEGSFIRDIKLTSDLSNDFATMVTIGAQANSNQVTENGTAFSNYNAGLEDRIIKTRYSSNDVEKAENNPDKNEQLYNIIQGQKSAYDSIYGAGGMQLSSPNISSFKENMNTAIKLALGIMTEGTKSTNPTLKSPFFLPFNLQLEMDGLSGMKLYEKFKITENVLPPSYEEDSIDIIIKGINHNIDTSAWTTKLDTLSGPSSKNLDGVVDIPPTKPSSTPPPDLIRRGDVENVGEPSSPLSPLLNLSKIEAMRSSYNGVFGRDGETPPKVGRCARWTYNLALNYISFLKGGTLKNPSIESGGNARDNILYHTNLEKLGYKRFTSKGLTKSRLAQVIDSTSWGVGDVIVYYANDKPTSGEDSHYVYGHTQIYVGDINSNDGGKGWATDKKANYSNSINPISGKFIYSNRNSNNWNLIVFRSPAE